MSTFQFGSSNASTRKAWAEGVARDAEHGLFFAPLMYPAGPSAQGAIRSPGYGKGAQIIKVHDLFKNESGDNLTITNVARINGAPTMGDAVDKNSSANLSTYTMTLGYDAARKTVSNTGKISDKKVAFKFRETAKPELASWSRRTTEGLILAHLYGIAAPTNSAVLTRLNLSSSLTTVFGNAVQAFDSDHLVYAGSANTTDAMVSADTSAVLTASLLDQIITKVGEDLSIPLEPTDLGNGEEGFIVPISGRGLEQLRADPDFREAVTEFNGPLNQLLKRKLPKYGNLVFVEYGNCLDPYANVGRMLVLGKDALQFAKVMDWEWWEGVEDTMDWKNLITIGAMMGAKATYFNSARRNALAVDFYKRS